MKQMLGGKIQKGEAGYAAAEKRRRLAITIGLFAIPLLIFFTAWAILGSRETIWTVIVVVGCLPACRSLVNLIMIFRASSMDRDLYERIRAHQGRLTMAYEMYMTFYEKSAFLDAAAVCGKTVVLLSTDPKTDGPYIASHAKEILESNGYRSDVKVVSTEKIFLERLDSMNENYDSLQAGLRDRHDDRYPGFSRDEIVRAVLLTMCL